MYLCQYQVSYTILFPCQLAWRFDQSGVCALFLAGVDLKQTPL